MTDKPTPDEIRSHGLGPYPGWPVKHMMVSLSGRRHEETVNCKRLHCKPVSSDRPTSTAPDIDKLLEDARCLVIGPARICFKGHRTESRDLAKLHAATTCSAMLPWPLVTDESTPCGAPMVHGWLVGDDEDDTPATVTIEGLLAEIDRLRTALERSDRQANIAMADADRLWKTYRTWSQEILVDVRRAHEAAVAARGDQQ